MASNASVLARELERDDMIEREEYDELPPLVEYTLTPEGGRHVACYCV